MADLELASEIGVLLADGAGVLHVVAASDERTHLLEMFQLQNREGPCLDCIQLRRAVVIPDLAVEVERWPVFARRALDVGFRSVQAHPLRLRDTVLGALNLFHVDPHPTTGEALPQALADIATISLLQQRRAEQLQTASEHLQGALHSRIAIEQAKGFLSHQAGVNVDDAFELLRSYARNHNLRLSDVAQGVSDRTIDAGELL
jgi:GAF domain-containing protein